MNFTLRCALLARSDVEELCAAAPARVALFTGPAPDNVFFNPAPACAMPKVVFERMVDHLRRLANRMRYLGASTYRTIISSPAVGLL